MADVFRKVYTPLSDEQKALVERVKTKAEELYTIIDETTGSREQSLAKTKLEESVMWAVKNITQ